MSMISSSEYPLLRNCAVDLVDLVAGQLATHSFGHDLHEVSEVAVLILVGQDTAT
jgi:hypothetical protein